jgi:hypothetical protein
MSGFIKTTEDTITPHITSITNAAIDRPFQLLLSMSTTGNSFKIRFD